MRASSETVSQSTSSKSNRIAIQPFDPKVSWHEEANRIGFNDATLLAQARLTGEGNHAIAVMVK